MENLDQIGQAVSEFTETASARMEALEQRFDDMNTRASVGRGRQTQPDGLGDMKPTQRQASTGARVLGPVARHSSAYGFRDFGDFAAAVRMAATPGGETDGRLMAAAASTYGNESSGTDGGFAIPPDFRAAIMEKAFGEMSLISRTDQVPVAGNSLTIPTSMTTPWGSDGITAYWTGEAAAITQSKPALQNVNVRLDKLSVLVPMTDELLEDAPAMGAIVSRMAGEKIDFKVSNAIAYGNGVGQPLGFMNSPVIISQDHGCELHQDGEPPAGAIARQCGLADPPGRRAAVAADDHWRPAGLYASGRAAGHSLRSSAGPSGDPAPGLSDRRRPWRHYASGPVAVSDGGKGWRVALADLDSPLVRSGHHRLPLRPADCRSAVVVGTDDRE
jgi:HK97 family phage major capsid protein